MSPFIHKYIHICIVLRPFLIRHVDLKQVALEMTKHAEEAGFKVFWQWNFVFFISLLMEKPRFSNIVLRKAHFVLLLSGP